MSVYVVDASVAVKWMLPEVLAAEAARLQSPVHELHAPSFFEVELANILWKKLRQVPNPNADGSVRRRAGWCLRRQQCKFICIRNERNRQQK
jgi:predicted nucleic acid-binding protein